MPDIAMGIDHNYVPSLPPAQNNVEKKVKVMPSVGIYQPPAARRLIARESVTEKTSVEKLRGKQRRPDIQVYVPRAKRLSSGAVSSSQEIQTLTTITSNRRHSSSMSSQNYATKPSKSIEVSDAKACPDGSVENTVSNSQIIADTNNINSSTLIAVDEVPFTNNSKEELSQDLIVYCDARRAELTGRDQDDGIINIAAEFESKAESIDNIISVSRLQIDNSQLKCSIDDNDLCQEDTDSPQQFQLDKSVDLVLSLDGDCSDTSNKDPCNIVFEIDKTILTVINENEDNKDTHKPTSDTNSLIGSDTSEITKTNKCLVEIVDKDKRTEKLDDEDKCRNHKEQNRKNRSIQRGNINYISDILVISDTEPSCDLIEPVPESSLSVQSNKSKTKKTILNREEEIGLTEIKIHHSNEESSNGNTQRLNPDECTWDMMFDENGDCLDPLLMEELTNKVGNVTIKSPRSDYKNYTTREFQPRDEYSHVIEIYDFPAEFKTQDLITVFSAYRSRGFEIKWVDDTHALGVFSSSVVAEEVLETSHPFLKTRPLHEATSESRAKARRSSEFLQPYRSRPETCPAMARRMVTGALGVRLSTARQEREAEKALLKVARDKKKLEARQKDEAWEGTIIGASSSNGD